MPRRPRITFPAVPLHIIQRGNNHNACFYADEDYQSYLSWLEEYSQESRCAIHANVLMTNISTCSSHLEQRPVLAR